MINDFKSYSEKKTSTLVSGSPRSTFAVEIGNLCVGFQYHHVVEFSHIKGEAGKELIDVTFSEKTVSIGGTDLTAIFDALLDNKLSRVQICEDRGETGAPSVIHIAIEKNTAESETES